MKRQISLPRLLANKLYKTGQTRGADDDDIFQNRVMRNSTVLIPFDSWQAASQPPESEGAFENGFIALIAPKTFFLRPDIEALLSQQGLQIGANALVFYETREDWLAFSPDLRGWNPATSRVSPLGGAYVARVPATTALDDAAIRLGFADKDFKGAGIRVYEYASESDIKDCRRQLEALFWLCHDATEVAARYGMTGANIVGRKADNEQICKQRSLFDVERLEANRIISKNHVTMCPLCLEEVSAEGFFSKVEQAEGRAVLDLTITQLNLFHIRELRVGQYNHRPYNLGWGHHHCNVVVKDAGIDPTLIWMTDVVDRNVEAGYISPRGTGSA